MNIVGRVSLSAAAGLLGVAVLLGSVGAPAAANSGAVAEMSVADAYFDSTIVLARAAQPRGARGDELTVALGYLERLRVGLGDPFRLVDDATNDPRLAPAMRSRVAWAILDRVRRGDAYVVDPAVLEGAGPWSPDGHGATGAAHLALIEKTVMSASDARAGDLSVRLAYALESAKGGISPSTATIASQVAALVRDRELSRRDLRALLSDSALTHTSLLALIAQRREDVALVVERPPLAPLSAALQVEAMNDVQAVMRTLDTLDRVAADVRDVDRDAASPVLGVHFADRLRVLGLRRPPVPQVLVTLRGLASARLSATNEETLAAAGAAGSATGSDSSRRVASLAVLSAAVAVRSLAQQASWFPGDAGATPSDLIAEFGLGGVTFGRAVPAMWQPFYLSELQTALRDMESVFPTIAFNGLHVRFGQEALRDSALAMHDPRTRTLELPLATAGGTIAHELSHDLDWQTARRLYANASGYSTDRAAVDRRGVLANSLRGLAAARPTRGNGAASPADRPTEMFARGSDWFVATVLAQRGRSNGFLSAIQDGGFAGYAAGVPATLGDAGTASLVATIQAMTYVPDSVRARFEAQWSDPRVIDPALLVRRVLETPVPWRSMSGQPSLLAVLPAAPLCAEAPTPLLRARENLLMLAADARAHGLAERRARFRPSAVRFGVAQSLLGVPPSSPEAGVRYVADLRSAIVAGFGASLLDQGVLPVAPPIFRSNASSCAAIAH